MALHSSSCGRGTDTGERGWSGTALPGSREVKRRGLCPSSQMTETAQRLLGKSRQGKPSPRVAPRCVTNRHVQEHRAALPKGQSLGAKHAASAHPPELIPRRFSCRSRDRGPLALARALPGAAFFQTGKPQPHPLLRMGLHRSQQPPPQMNQCWPPPSSPGVERKAKAAGSRLTAHFCSPARTRASAIHRFAQPPSDKPRFHSLATPQKPTEGVP